MHSSKMAMIIVDEKEGTYVMTHSTPRDIPKNKHCVKCQEPAVYAEIPFMSEGRIRYTFYCESCFGIRRAQLVMREGMTEQTSRENEQIRESRHREKMSELFYALFPAEETMSDEFLETFSHKGISVKYKNWECNGKAEEGPVVTKGDLEYKVCSSGKSRAQVTAETRAIIANLLAQGV